LEKLGDNKGRIGLEKLGNDKGRAGRNAKTRPESLLLRGVILIGFGKSSNLKKRGL